MRRRRLTTTLTALVAGATLIAAAPIGLADADAPVDPPVDAPAEADEPDQLDRSAGVRDRGAWTGPGRRGVPWRPNARFATCAGVRGNGQRLFAHYGVLARQVEEYGAVKCIAGGSSGSITAFIHESIWANPDVHRCGQRRCRIRERDARTALMLKSVVGLVDTGVVADVRLLADLVQDVSDLDIEALLAGPTPQEGVDAFVRALRDLGPLINQEVVELLLTSPDPVFHATDIIDGLQKGLSFVVDDPRVFLRTSVLDTDAFALLLGSVGSFYAAYGPADRSGVAEWLETCARPSVGLTWEEAAVLPAADGETCGEQFGRLFDEYRERFADLGGPNRANDPVGWYLPAFGVTGVLTGDAVDRWEAARAAWIAADPIPFEPSFSDVGVGWWGKERELRRMDRRLDRRFDDLGSSQFVPLGQQTWREVLASSPAEPGFSPGVPLASGVVSVGGWADPLRVLPLEALGARRTITVNRRDGVGGFTEQVTRLLGASDADVAALYSPTDPASTFFRGLDQADGVWCTDWDTPPASDVDALFADGYGAPLITENRRFLRPRNGYVNVGPDFVIGGCTPGVTTLIQRRSSS
ncbi:MAG: hypothetical protein AAFP84_14640 [Actinomycetota bacterium]